MKTSISAAHTILETLIMATRLNETNYDGYLASRLELFLTYVGQADLDECWLWLPSKNGKGYGSFTICRVDGTAKTFGAHVVAYALSRFINPFDLPSDRDHVIMHRCDNPACCNPTHLIMGTEQENVADKVAKSRHYHVPAAPDDYAWCYGCGDFRLLFMFRSISMTGTNKTLCAQCRRRRSRNAKRRRLYAARRNLLQLSNT